MSETTLARVLRRDRALVLAAIAVLTALAWAYVAWLAWDMDMGGMDMSGFRMIPSGLGWMMPAEAPWGAFEFVLVFLMWALMMVGMMTPSVAPMLLLHARVGRQALAQGHPFAATGWFAAGYLLAWTGFALVAATAQWALERLALLTPLMQSASSMLAGLVLVAAGAYQFSPLKDRCLTACQAPLVFLQRHGGFRRDVRGALALGVKHGAYCIGCCWALMALLFVGGVMNLLWIAALAVFVLLEKLVAGRLLSRLAGVALTAWGLLLLLRAM